MKTRLINENFSYGKDFFKEEKILNQDVTVHWHNFYEFDIVLSGDGETILNGKKYDVKRGMISFLSPMDFHEYKPSDDTKVISIQFKEKEIDCELLNKYLSLKRKIVFVDEKTLENIEMLSKLLGNIDESSYSEEYNKKILECIIINFLNCCEPDIDMPHVSSSMQRAIIYINTHFYENPSMKNIADMFFLNSSYFSRNFKNSMGITYKEYLRKLKLEYSRKLIKYTDLSMIDISLKSGYENQSHFTREFKKYYDITPTSLRKE